MKRRAKMLDAVRATCESLRHANAVREGRHDSRAIRYDLELIWFYSETCAENSGERIGE